MLLLLLLGARPGNSALHRWGARVGKEEPFCYPFNYTCGPITPAPPTLYEAHLEQTDLLFNITQYIEEFYDYEAGVLAVTHTVQNVYTHIINFYHINKAVIMWTERGIEEGIRPTTCTVADITHNTWSDTFPGQTNATDLVLAPSQALLFGDDYKYSWVENNTQRGIICNRWDACFTRDEGTFYVEYEWSDPARVSEGPGYPRERPIRMHMNGLVKPFQGSYESFPVDYVYSFGLFDENPRSEDVRWAYEIPSGVYCEGLPAGKDPPKALTNAFSMRVEVTGYSSNSHNQEYTSTVLNWYDFSHQLTRYDSIAYPGTVEYEAAGLVEVAVIRDFRSGVEYVVDKSLGNCTTLELTGGFDTITTPDGHHSIKNPLLLFGLEGTNLVYHGTKYARGLPCDVWVGHFDFEEENNTIHNAYLYEVYILQDGWTEDAGEADQHLPVPVLIKVFQDISVGELPEELIVNLQQNIFKFQEEVPLMTVYDITPCFTGHDHIRRFQMAFPGQYRHYYDDDPQKFTHSVHNSLVDYLPLSPIRVQHLEIEYLESDDRLYCEFTLVDQPQVDMEFPPYVGKPLDQVVQTLEDQMDYFSIVILDSNGNLVWMKPYNDSLREMFEDGCYSRREPRQPLPPRPNSDDPRTATQPNPSPTWYSSGGDGADGGSVDFAILAAMQKGFRSSDEKIYTPGAMAGMAVGMLVLGLLLGTVIMLVILKKMGLTTGIEFIPMNSRRR